MLRSTRAAAGAAAVLLSLGLTACGGDGGDGDNGGAGSEPEAQAGPPADASVEDFCATINDDSLYADVDPENPDPADIVTALQALAADLEEVGTPEDISADAREGFEISLEQIGALEPGDIDLQSQEDPLAEGLSEDEVAKVEALNEYATTTCVEESPTAPE